MKVLVACEFSGIVRDAFADRGHDAWSCDLLPSERPGQHIQGDVLAVLGDGWDLMIAAPIARWAIENPVSVISTRIRKPDQIIQPWQFGHGETKTTCLWLHGLPKLTPTDIVDGREARVHRMPPGPNRWAERSRTFAGIAQAMAEQWGQ